MAFFRPAFSNAVRALLVLVSYSCFSQSSTVRFRHLSLEEGLSSTYVTSIVQDRKGFMWVGTWKGLNRYDGYQFKTFRHNPADSLSLGSGGVYAILEDRDGILWVGMSSGLDRFDRKTETFTHFFQEKGTVLSLHEDREGNLWVGTVKGLVCYQKKTGQSVRFQNDPNNPNSLCDNFITAISQANDGCIWVGTRSGLNKYNPQTGVFQRFLTNPEAPLSAATISHNCIMALMEDSNGLLLIGTKGVLDIYDPEKKQNQFSHGSQPTYAILRDRNDASLWLGTPNGLFQQNRSDSDSLNRYFSNPAITDGLSSNLILVLFQDREGALWIGTDNGINILAPEKIQFRCYKNNPGDSESLSSNLLRSVAVSRDNMIWVGTNGAGLNRLDPVTGKAKRYLYNPNNSPYATNHGSIMGIFEDSKGVIWIGLMNNGLDRMNPRDGKFLHHQWKDFRDLVSVFYEDQDGVVWLGHQGGVSHYDQAKDEFEYHSFAPNGSRKGNLPIATGILPDSSGRLWVSSNGLCLNRFDPKNQTFQRFAHDSKNFHGVVSDNVQSIYNDQKGQLWVGTDKGLDLFDHIQENFTHFNLENGLPDLMMGQMEEDGQGKLWIATGRGITRFDPITGRFRNFDKNDGLSSNESWDFTKNEATGEMYLATADGLTVFHPDSLRDNLVPPLIVFTKFTRYQSQLHQEIEETGISEKSELTLSYLDDILTFEFAALSFRKSSKNQYAYKLEGFNNQWIPLGTKRTVTFTNLSPRSYTLKVKASNGDGIWNEAGISLKITVTPPWWDTWYAYLLYAIVATSGLYAAYRFQLKRKLATAETLRLKELDAVKTRLYTNITHEFRTPLTVIGGMVEQIRENPEKWLKEGLEMIGRNNRNLLRLVNQMLDLNKLESGSLPINLIHDDILLYLNYLCESFHSYAESKKVRLLFEPALEKCYMDYDSEKIEQIVSNLLSNAIKFTPEGGTVIMKAQQQNPKQLVGHLEICVLDTGIGIAEDQLPFVFDRFYQAKQSDDSYHEGGTGIGLALTKELVKLLGGRIIVSSTLGKGTAFTLWLPLRQKGRAIAQVGNTSPQRKVARDLITTLPTSETISPFAEAKEHLLLIEDNADVVRYMTTFLGTQYNLSVASNGAQGLEQAMEHVPDLIISDVMMPRMDGFELCAALKRDERSSHIPVILLTAKGDMASKLEGLQHGADAYLIKPFNKDELLVQIQNLLELRRSLQAYYLALATNPHPSLEAQKNQVEENAFVLKVRGIIEEHLSDSALDVEQLCRKVGMSNSQLHRKLTALTGYSANRFVRYIRLTKACTLLQQDSNLTIVAVAYDCGFNDPVYFARAFRQEFGVSPSEWRSIKPG
ncbi:MAG: response regulator [Saprospiraceae bacterium]|nr:response regulator [Saprospiraceae bacterium]